MVALLEPFIDTICICTLTGLVVLSSGAWNTKTENRFQTTDMQYVQGVYDDTKDEDVLRLGDHLRGKASLPLFSGGLVVENGNLVTEGVSLIHARSLAGNIVYTSENIPYSGVIEVIDGKLVHPSAVDVTGESLTHSAQMTTFAFSRSIMKGSGRYIVALGLLLFAFSTAISWSYYGDRAVTFLIGQKYVIYYRKIGRASCRERV